MPLGMFEFSLLWIYKNQASCREITPQKYL